MMSYSVKAGESPSPQVSPFMRPYVSPQMLPQAGQRVPPISLSEEQLPSKRVGTDPTKYKTTICRNWEQTGTCTFRGCTFAHGVDELRAPTRMCDTNNTPQLHSQYVSPGATPPFAPTSTTPANHFGGTGSGGPPKLESLLEMLYGEVVRERELVAVHIEANRTLERMLRREQAQHADTKALLVDRRNEYSALVDVVGQQNTLLQNLFQQHTNGGSDLSSSRERVRALVEDTTALLSMGIYVETDDSDGAQSIHREYAEDQRNDSVSSSEAGECKEKEKKRIEELLRALQQPQHS